MLLVNESLLLPLPAIPTDCQCWVPVDGTRFTVHFRCWVTTLLTLTSSVVPAGPSFVSATSSVTKTCACSLPTLTESPADSAIKRVLKF